MRRRGFLLGLLASTVIVPAARASGLTFGPIFTYSWPQTKPPSLWAVSWGDETQFGVRPRKSRYDRLKEGSDHIRARADAAVASGEWVSYWCIANREFPDVIDHIVPNRAADALVPWRA